MSEMQSQTIGALAEALEVPGAPGYYATRDGRVLSCIRDRVRQLRPMRSGQMGYQAVQFGAAGRRVYVHRLIAEMFLEPPSPGALYVRHLDGDLNNNSASNLAWGTAQDNSDDMRRHGRVARGERNGMAKLTARRVAQIRLRLRYAKTQREVAREFGVSFMQMSRIARGVAW